MAMRIAICDDEPRCCDVLSELLAPYIEQQPTIQLDVFHTGEALLACCHDVPTFDIAFLDIEIGEMSGLDVARRLLSMNKQTIIFFTTSHVHYVSETFRLKTFQFLVKPIQPDVFRHDFERALRKYHVSHTKYVIRWRDQETCIEHKDILFIEVSGKHLKIHTATDTYECVGRLAEEEARLSGFQFIKSHQSYLVNLAHIRTIEKDVLIMSDGSRALLSRSLRKNVLDTFNLYIAGYSV